MQEGTALPPWFLLPWYCTLLMKILKTNTFYPADTLSELIFIANVVMSSYDNPDEYHPALH